MTSFAPRNVRPFHVALLAGGISAERSISLESGAAVRAALVARRHRVTWLDPAEVALEELDWRPFDVAFLALHGAGGEDGTVQTLLESAGVPYTGSDANASKLAFGKSACKERFLRRAVPTPGYVLIHESDDAARIERLARALGFPLVVKPDAQGSSLGVSLVESPDDLPAALGSCFQYDRFGLLETAIRGSEWTVGFLDDRALAPLRIDSPRAIFDFDAKYADTGTTYRFADESESPVARAVESAAAAARSAVGTRGLARVDLRVDRQGCPWVLEVNTIPGLTSHSLVPKAAAHEGLAFEDLIETCLRQALRDGRRALAYVRGDVA